MDADLQEAKNQLEIAYSKVLLIVETINQKGYGARPIVEKGKLTGIDLWPISSKNPAEAAGQR